MKKLIPGRNKILLCLAALSSCLSMPVLAQDEGVSDASADSIMPRRIDLQTSRRDDNQAHEEWQGSFALEGTDTRIKIGGFLQLDLMYDTNAMLSKGQFIPSTIVTRNASKKDGSDGKTNFSASPSRLYVETRTRINQKRMKTLLSLDMFDDELGVDAKPHLRQAYVQLDDILFGGDLLIGQAWSTTTNLESAPDVLDFHSVNALFGKIQPQLRWSRDVANGVKLMLALETADNHIIEGADTLTRMPDGVLAVTWDSDSFKLMASLLAADLRASFNNGPVKSVLGFGGSISGKVKLPYGSYENDFMFSAAYGRGIASHFYDGQPDAVFDPATSNLELLKGFGVTLAYSHGWNEQMKSTFTYCCVEIQNHDAQSPESFHYSEYSSGNLVWTMNTHWLLGVEGIWGKRKDNDGMMGSNFRTQFTSRVSF